MFCLRKILIVVLAYGVVACGTRGPVTQEPNAVLPKVISDWNETVLEVAAAEDSFLTLKGLRTATLMHLAIHDSLSAIDERAQPYLGHEPVPGAEPLAAVVQAAYEIAVDQYPDEKERFAAQRDSALAADSAGVAASTDADEARRAAGLRLGGEMAAALLASRNGDGWDSEAEYQWHPMGPGVYAEFQEHSGTPAGFVFGAGWASAKSWMLDGPDQFRAPPPPAIDSTEYARAFDEVREVGRFESLSRTEDQTHLAYWWKDFAENSQNRLARHLVLASNGELDGWQTARLFALLNMSIYDAYLGVFENKFLYNHWRPYTAIRWASKDGNPATEEEPEWNNAHRHTYAFPSYPSAHGTACASAMTVFADVFGASRPFTMTTNEVDSAGPFSSKKAMAPPTRSFDSFSDAAKECGLSRVYLGIHFRYDADAGYLLGSQIGEFGVKGYLTLRSGD